MSVTKSFDIEHFPTSPSAVRMMSRISPIYGKSYVGKWIFQVMGLEVDGVRLRFEELRAQAFPETATWGLVYWELRYGITPQPGATIEQRRRTVLTKRGAREPMNPAKMERLVETMTGCPAHVTEDVAPYTFNVEIYAGTERGDFDFDAVYSKLKRIKPSHLQMQVFLTTDAGIQIKSSRDIYSFPYRLAGTYPQTNTLGAISENAVTASIETSSTSFSYPLCGDNDN